MVVAVKGQGGNLYLLDVLPQLHTPEDIFTDQSHGEVDGVSYQEVSPHHQEAGTHAELLCQHQLAEEGLGGVALSD